MRRYWQGMSLLLGLGAILALGLSCEPGSSLFSPMDPFAHGGKDPDFIDWGRKDPPMPSFPMLQFQTGKLPKELLPEPTLVRRPKPRKRPVKKPTPKVMTQPPPKVLGDKDKAFAQKVASYYGQGRSYRLVTQTDKPLYKPGETIWVRTVELRLRDEHTRPQTCASVYSLKDPRGVVLRKARVPVYNGHSQFQFKLGRRRKGGEYAIHVHHLQTGVKTVKKIFVNAYQPPRIKKKLEFIRKGYGAGDTVEATLTLRAPTGGPLARHRATVIATLADKTLKRWEVVTSDKGKVLLSFALPKKLKAHEGLLVVVVQDAGVTESISRPIPLFFKKLKVGFFPEGGKLALDLTNRVYFAVRNPLTGRPQDVEAQLLTPEGKLVTKVRSFHDGMGRFVFKPTQTKPYLFKITKPAEIETTFLLPAATEHSVSLRWEDDARSERKDIHVVVSSRRDQSVVLIALQGETVLAQKPYHLVQGPQRLKLPLRFQRRGILRLTLFDDAYQPLAERLIFRHRTRGLKFKIVTDKKHYQPRQTVHVKVKVTDLTGNPLRKAILGTSVVDDTVLSFALDQEPNFLVQRYLSTQLVGKIYKPNFYFKKDKPKAPRALDLVMGTHGWRDFSWDKVREGTPPKKILALRGSRPRHPDFSAGYLRVHTPRSLLASLRRRTSGTSGIGGLSSGSGRGYGLGGRGYGLGGGGIRTRTTRRRRKPRIRRKRKRRKVARVRARRRRGGGVLKDLLQRRQPAGIARAARPSAPPREATARPRRDQGGQKKMEKAKRRGPRTATAERTRLAAQDKQQQARIGDNRAARARTKSREPRVKQDPAPMAGGGTAAIRGLGSTRSGSGALGLLGGGRVYGRGGMNRGYGKGYGQRTVPIFRAGRPTVMGSLDSSIIRRIIRRYAVQFRYCYQRELVRNPSLQGRMNIQFTIAPTGRVTNARTTSSTLGNRRVTTCIRRRAYRMRFPRPKGGGIVIVRYPFLFRKTTRSIPYYRRRRYRRYRRYRPVRRRVLRWAYPRQFPTRFYEEDKGAKRHKVRKDFRDTIYWNPHLVTDAWGEARFSFGLSDKVTSFRLRVAGVGGGLLGTKDKVIASKRPFFMVVKLPLEVSAGDAMALPLTIRNDSDKALSVTIKPRFSYHFKLMEDPLPKAVDLPAGSARTYFYPVRVIARRGTAHATFSAQTKGFHDELQRKISIQARGYPRGRRWSGRLTPKKRHTFTFSLPKDRANLRTRLRVYPTPIRTLTQALASMLRYPSGCFEQSSSKNYPNIMLIQYMRTQPKPETRLLRRAYSYLSAGYRKLQYYRSHSGGFAWFPNGAAHEALSAYGLMQFVEMKKVYSRVSQSLIEETARWLLSRRAPQGGFLRSASRYGSFGRASKSITDAYITFALAQAGRREIKGEVAALTQRAANVRDPYLLALALHANLSFHGRGHANVKMLYKKLLPHQEKNGSFLGASHSFTRSTGRNLHIETTGLAAHAIMRVSGLTKRAKRAVRWLLSKRRYGRFGTTQATVLALKALVTFERLQTRRAKPRKHDSLKIWVNDTLAQTLRYDPTKRNRLHIKDFAKLLRTGKNTISVQLSSARSMPYSLGVSYYTRIPLSHKGVAVSLSTALSKQVIKMGEVVRLRAIIQNKTNKGLPMVLARIPYPGAFRTQIWQLKDLKKKKKVDFYETGARELIVYLRGMAPRAKKTIYLDLIARVTGNYTSATPRAYLYYSDHRKHWGKPLRVSVTPQIPKRQTLAAKTPKP